MTTNQGTISRESITFYCSSLNQVLSTHSLCPQTFIDSQLITATSWIFSSLFSNSSRILVASIHVICSRLKLFKIRCNYCLQEAFRQRPIIQGMIPMRANQVSGVWHGHNELKGLFLCFLTFWPYLRNIPHLTFWFFGDLTNPLLVTMLFCYLVPKIQHSLSGPSTPLTPLKATSKIKF